MSNRVFKELFHPILFVVRHRRLLPGQLLVRLVAIYWIEKVYHRFSSTVSLTVSVRKIRSKSNDKRRLPHGYLRVFQDIREVQMQTDSFG